MKNKELFGTIGDTALIMFIASLLMVAVLMFFKNEDLAEYFGNIAFLFLLAAFLLKIIYNKI